MTPREPARERLREFLRQHPNPCVTFTGQEVADQIGVSRERVRQLMGGSYKRVLKSDYLLALFVRYHPEAQLPKSLGGMSYSQIGKELGLGTNTVGNAFRRLGLVQHSQIKVGVREQNRIASQRYYQSHKDQHRAWMRAWKEAHPEKCRESNRQAQVKYNAKVLRIEHCIVCGVEFPWTQQREKARRKMGCRIVCGSGCGRKAARREREA